MSNNRARTLSVSSAFASLPRPHSIRRSQSAASGPVGRTIRVVVLGVGGVGKTAMAVRFITKRFIGDYDPNLETIYRHTTSVDDELVNYEIMDTAGQEESNNLTLEDKCKWGESFVFVYDVTDKYSFDQLRQLKFVASYTHSRMRVNFTPCWVLIGNKVDLAQHERMVSQEEGEQLARELGCHFFREISTRESVTEATGVFEDIWREFSHRSPRSPSSSQRRKSSYRIQDKIPVLCSNASTCASEAIKTVGSTGSLRGLPLKRQSSTPAMPLSARLSKVNSFNDNNNNKAFFSGDSFDNGRNIMRIPEADDEDSDPPITPPPTSRPPRTRRNAVMLGMGDSKPPCHQRGRRGALSKATSADNVYASISERPTTPSDATATLSSSSTSSSTTSLNGTINPNLNASDRSKLNSLARGRSSSDAGQLEDQKKSRVEHLTGFISDHRRVSRVRSSDSGKCRRSVSPLPTLPLKSTFEVGGY